jgi:hypothetical protein
MPIELSNRFRLATGHLRKHHHLKRFYDSQIDHRIAWEHTLRSRHNFHLRSALAGKVYPMLRLYHT